MYSSTVEKAIASGKLSHMEKYGFAHAGDLAMVERMLDAKVAYSSDRKQARVVCGGIDITIQVREGGEDFKDNSWKKAYLKK